MQGQKEGQVSDLRRAREQRHWTKDDVVAALVNLGHELSEPSPLIDPNLVGKWERGDRHPGKYYAPRLCVIFDASPESLGFLPRPRLTASIRDLKSRLTKHRQSAVRIALAVGSTGMVPDVEWGRLAGLIPLDQPHRPEDFQRFVSGFASQLDTVAPVALMPQVLSLLRQAQRHLERDRKTDVLAAACNTAIIAGWLSYNIHNRGDATAMWSYADQLAKESGSGQLRAYVLGCKSYLFSGVPRRGETWHDASLPTALLDEAIAFAAGTASPSLRAWLYARRAEENAVSGRGTEARRDLNSAYAALGTRAPSLSAEDVPILTEWRDARLARYHGSMAQLLGDYIQAGQILRATLDHLDPNFIPQRVMAMTDLATIYARQDHSEPERAASLLSEALQISEQTGLIEATMRVAEARKYLSPWHDELFVRRLDDQLRFI